MSTVRRSEDPREAIPALAFCLPIVKLIRYDGDETQRESWTMARTRKDAASEDHAGVNGRRSDPAADRAALLTALDQAITRRHERMVRFRRRLHATPEPSNEEYASTALIAETLREAGIDSRIMRGRTGVICDIDLGAPADSFIALRAELDCVRVNDDKQVPYASTRAGLCHACGHDVHSTMVLSAGITLFEHVESIRPLEPRQNLRLIFQPAEETATGARSMIEQNAIDGVKAILALHVDPAFEPGTVGLRNGPLTAACKIFRIAIKGRSGHTARPFEAVDPIPAATNLIGLLYQLGPRSIDTRYPLAVTVASIKAGEAFNAIPDEAHISGTIRCARVDDMQAVQNKLDMIVRGMKETIGCEITVEYPYACPPTDNHPELIGRLAQVGSEMLGPEHVHWIDVPSMGGEDFAFYQELIPGVLVRLGAALPDPRRRRPLHSSHFDIDETALAIGSRLLCRSVIDLVTNDVIPRT